MTSKAAYSDKSKISFMIIFSIWTVWGKKTYSLNFLLRNLIVLILAGNLQLLYFIYKTLHSQGKTFCEDYWKKNLQHMAGSSSFLALLLPESVPGLASLLALPVRLVQSEEPFWGHCMISHLWEISPAFPWCLNLHLPKQGSQPHT